MRNFRVGITLSLATLLVVVLAACGKETVNFPDLTPPFVISTTPAQGASGVALNPVISATFSKPVNSSTVNTTTFTVSGPGGPIAGTVALSGNTATFTPTTPLAAQDTLYTATITTGVADLVGNTMQAPYVWTFEAMEVPGVISTTPAAGAKGVPTNQVISATFPVDADSPNSALNCATITKTTFTVTSASGAVAGTVTCSGATAVFTPTALLAQNTIYTATITTGAQNLGGVALPAAFVWTFTTGSQPTLVSTVPANGATGVQLTQSITANFSATMNCATLYSPAKNFTLTGPGGASVIGAVTCSGTSATFTPAVPLAPGTLYTATVSSGAMDLQGQPLVSGAVPNPWTFTTAPTPSVPVVTSTTPANNAIGVPSNQKVSVTFNEAMNPATINTSTFTLMGPGGASVAGTVTYTLAGSVATFTPAAGLASLTTYVATITTGAKDASGNGMAANYTFSFTTGLQPSLVATIPANGATGVLPNQNIIANFNEPMNCSTLASPAKTFTVTGPGGVSVAGNVTCLGATATFTPAGALAPNTLYTAAVSSGAQDPSGQPLIAGFAPNPWTFRTAPAVVVAPTVISTAPVNSALGVPINQKITATFSEAMNPGTINTTTFTLAAPGGVSVAGVVTYAVTGSIATFAPAANLTPLTTYVATITTGAQDLAGNGLAANYVFTFTTGAAADVTRPTVISTIPANGATAVPLNQAISATFSKAMDATTINGTTFTVTGPGVVPVVGFVTYAAIGNTATFTPAAPLLAGTLYTGTVTTGAKDLSGNPLLNNYVFTFTTAAAVNNVPPTIVSTNPASAATNVAVNATVNATFSEAMDPLTITTATFQLSAPGGAAVAGTVAYDAINFIATFTPTVALLPSTTYTATVTNGATDLAGNPLVAGAAPNPWVFTTSAVIVPPPAVTLGSAALFGGFGGNAGMTNQGIFTVVNGNIGTTGVSTLITGFHDAGPGCTYTETPLNIGFVNGAIDTAPPPPTVACPTEGTAVTSAIAAKAALDTLTAYGQLVAFPGGMDVSTCPGCGGGAADELGNRTLAPGIYKSAPGSYAISLGDLTLDAQGNPNAFWVFQMATSLTVGTPTFHRSVLLINGAQAKNVFWQVGSAATINGVLGGGTMSGTIIAQSGVSVSTAGVVAITTVNGRLLVLTGPVTIVNTVVNVPAP